MVRCINIDWLECYCLEDSIGYPHDAQHFREKGWVVLERDYGTPVYEQMFTLIGTDGESWCEIRRKPKSDKAVRGVLNHFACHVRLTNRSCYRKDCVKLLQRFLDENGIHYQRISRIDLCLDFERFDSGDYPGKFLERYVQERFSKINQAEISLHGLDQWDGRKWNSVKWGAPSSMIQTRLYNKTLELKKGKDKPYIRQQWQVCGLVDDWATCRKKTANGAERDVEVWRLEFAIKSGTKNWFVMEDYNGDRKRKRSVRNDLNCYKDKQQILNVFFSLAHHYFHFKHVVYKQQSRALVAGSLRSVSVDVNSEHFHRDKSAVKERERKDRSPDKILFYPKELSEFYYIEKPLTENKPDKFFAKLASMLSTYMQMKYEGSIKDICAQIIRELELDDRKQQLSYPITQQEINFIQTVISVKMNQKGITVNEAIERAKTIIEEGKDIWK